MLRFVGCDTKTRGVVQLELGEPVEEAKPDLLSSAYRSSTQPRDYTIGKAVPVGVQTV